MDRDSMAELPADVKQNMTRYKAPPGLERRIRHMVMQESNRPSLLDRLRERFANWVPLTTSFACGVLVAATLSAVLLRPTEDDEIGRQAVAAHVRSLQADHLMDVASTDQHTVKPWFMGKLDFSPPVVDLAQAGFPLIGGRLDYLNDRAVAALVYQRRGHRINVFVMPESDTKRMSAGSTQRHGYQVAEWQSGGMRFYAVSDISRDEMQQFALALQASH